MPNLRSLDALRGILATYVLLGHARTLLWSGHAAWAQGSDSVLGAFFAYASVALRFGYEAVIVFFALSGFFIHFRAAQAIAGGHGYRLDSKLYLRRRAHRILPPYILALVVTIVCDQIGKLAYPALYDAQTGDAYLDLNFARKGYDASSVLPAVFALPSLLGRDFGSNGPLWSLACEICYYVIYPIWYRLRCLHPGAAFVGVPVACMLLGAVGSNIPSIRIVSYYPVWLMGALLAEAALKNEFRCKGRVPALLTIAGCVTLFRSEYLPWAKPIAASIFGAAAVALFYSLPMTACHRVWHRVCESLGVQSYTIYIMHFPLLAMGCALLFRTLGERPSTGYAAVVGAFSTLLVCLGLFHGCERHFLHRRFQVGGSPPTSDGMSKDS